MDTQTGKIINIDSDDMKELMEAQETMMQENDFPRFSSREDKMVSLTEDEVKDITPLTLKQRKGWMRNQPCVCGSGKKFKKCCWGEFK